MAPVKNSSSSRRKEKEAVYDPPVEQETGKEAVYSELNHFDEEEARRDLDSECAPLIDPWYDVHPSFPKIPGDYVPLSQSCVRLALYRWNLNVS